MMKSVVYMLAAVLLVYPLANAGGAYTVEDYNASLVKYGVPFYTHYPASFYTGFAPRVEQPNRIHFRASRGNQVRLTAILDEYTILTYLYSLQKRYDTYGQAQSKGMLQTKSTNQLDAFRRIIDSPAYDIKGKIVKFESGEMDKAQFYQASLDTLSKLNPHRVFNISIDLQDAFKSWKAQIQSLTQNYKDDPKDIETIKQHLFKPDDTLVLTNEILFGRVNAIYLTEEQTDKLAAIVSHVLSDPTEDKTFLALVRDYFIDVTQGKYELLTVAEGKFVPALQCDRPDEKCILSYPEFTAIYPNGSVIASTQDRQKNTIHMIRNNALMTFIDRRYHDVDHIRREGYYGYAPKMDWEGIGNGVHNPGVSHYLPSMPHLYQELEIPEDYKFIWVVSRGPVSSGCVRMSTGHLWELRHVFPASPERLKALLYFGNRSADYDVFDIDGNGTPEVMGSEYYVAYSLQGPSGDAKRKGKNFSLADVTKSEFFDYLYGQRGQFVQEGQSYAFDNPHVSHFRKTDTDDKKGAVISRPLQGTFTLYEQPYEKDKVQIYRLPPEFQKQLSIKDNTESTGKQMVRVLGRVSACGPFQREWKFCYEDQFDQEFEKLTGML